jgi:hypothetical protein
MMRPPWARVMYAVAMITSSTKIAVTNTSVLPRRDRLGGTARVPVPKTD